ncbi:metallophosphoesterase family protein [bacterium]|nr:metallophosphoesterase family protein [bacterium]
MKKFAVISDIHGNMQALNTVLNDIKVQKADEVLCLGDYAMAGPEPDISVNFFMKKANEFKMIQGNTDEYIANFSDTVYENIKKNAPIMANALKCDVNLLTSEQKEFLKNLPKQLEINDEGVKILLVHGSPRSISENIFPDMQIEEVEKMIESTDADIILCGHTHIPCGYQTNTKQTVINTGSVGRPFTDDPKACYLLITVNNGEFTAEHRQLDYDKKSASEILAKRNFDGAEKLAQMLINPELRHI